MRTKREFYKQLTAGINDSLSELKALDDDVRALDAQIKSGEYTTQHINNVLKPQKAQKLKEMDVIRAKGTSDAQRLCDDYTEELKAEFDLDPALINDDIKLIKAGILLKQRDIDSMLKRNADNPTMTQIILRYCEERGIKTGVVFAGNNGLISDVSIIPRMVDTVLRFNDNQPVVYDKLLGENSKVYEIFNSD